MKKYVIIGVLAVLSSSLFAQGELINQYLNKYETNEDFVKVSINSKMFSLFTEMESESEDEQAFLEAVSKLKGLKVLASDSIPEGSARIFKKASNDVEEAGYEELMTVKDAEENIKFSIKEKKGIIEELLMIVGGNQKFIFLSLYGEIDLKSVSKLASSMRVDALKDLEKLDN